MFNIKKKEEKKEEEEYEFFILYGVYNNNPMTWLSKAKNRGEVYIAAISNGIHLNLLDQLTEEEYLLCTKALNDRNVELNKAKFDPNTKIITIPS